VPNVSEQQNRATLERFFDVFSRHDFDAMTELIIHDDYVEEFPSRARGSMVRTMGER
jgi:ketosteroid isomerase-like protein